MQMGVTLSGGEGLLSFFNAKTKVAAKAIEVTKSNGMQMQQKAQRLAPVDTGFLKRNIHLNFVISGLEFTATVSGDANYDPYQEYGTRFQPGKPHIRPAYYAQRTIFETEMGKLANRK